MLISASRRTDIPAFYADWFINRLNAGHCLVKNPFNPQQIRRVSLLSEDVDGIVLWTKNAAPLLELRSNGSSSLLLRGGGGAALPCTKIATLDKFQYYFQYSITPYHSDLESGLADKKTVVIPAFIELAKRIGAERMIWRYDPIVINERYTHNYHIGAFSRLCELLTGSTKKCVISFVIEYKSVAKNMREIGSRALDLPHKLLLVNELSQVAKAHGITLHACCEELGLPPVSCVDSTMFGLELPRDKNQRDGCNCAVSVDIGAYNSCMNGCRYCYANHVGAKVRANYSRHDVNGELLGESK